MEKLIAQLFRLYVRADIVPPERLSQHLLGQGGALLDLGAPDGMTRTVVIPFDKSDDSEEAGHWTRLCAVASAMQVEHGFPAPAVSVDGVHGYCLWISLAAPVPVAQAWQLIERLRDRYFPDMALRPEAAHLAPPLPPCFIERAGRWAAFIHPGMGASFADEPGLDAAPPIAAQCAFLEDLKSVSLAQFQQALDGLAPAPAPTVTATPAPPPPTVQARPSPTAGPDLLLRDATLEDIVRHLHARNIEPTFRHLLPGGH